MLAKSDPPYVKVETESGDYAELYIHAYDPWFPDGVMLRLTTKSSEGSSSTAVYLDPVAQEALANALLDNLHDRE